MQTVVAEGSVYKTAITSHGRKRLRREVANLRRLEQTGLVPRIIAQDASGVELEYIAGQSMADWLQLQPDWRAASSAAEVPAHLQAYVVLEMGLLQAGMMYRDLNLQHVVFTSQGARMLDLEAAEYSPQGEKWRVTSRRGTYETMAPEEFMLGRVLTPRTATYRVAVVMHLALAGQLPFQFSSGSRRKAYQWRRSHPPEISSKLPYAVQRALQAALQPHPARRHKDPARLFDAVAAAYGWTTQEMNYSKPARGTPKPDGAKMQIV